MLEALKKKRPAEIVGYVIVLIVLAGLIWIAVWIFGGAPGKRFKGIEKFRGECPSEISRDRFVLLRDLERPEILAGLNWRHEMI